MHALGYQNKNWPIVMKQASSRILDVITNNSYKLVHVVDKNISKFILKNNFGEEKHIDKLGELQDLIDAINRVEDIVDKGEYSMKETDMIEVISEFQKDAKKLGRNENSIEELKIWVKGANEEERVVLDFHKINDELYNFLLEAFREQFGEQYTYEDWEISAVKEEFEENVMYTK